MGLEYFCFEGDGLWSATDADLVALATKEMEILGLVKPDQVVGGTVVRQEKAYPVYDETYAANVTEMRSELEARYPTLHLVGRKRHAPLQQPGSCDDDGHADRPQHPGRHARL